MKWSVCSSWSARRQRRTSAVSSFSRDSSTNSGSMAMSFDINNIKTATRAEPTTMTVVHLSLRGATVGDPAPVFHHALHRSDPLPTICTIVVRRLRRPAITPSSSARRVRAGFRCRPADYRLRSSRDGEFRCKLAGFISADDLVSAMNESGAPRVEERTDYGMLSGSVSRRQDGHDGSTSKQ